MATEIDCPECHKTFTRHSNLTRHLKRYHPSSQHLNSSRSPDQTPHLVVCLRRESFQFTLENAPHLYIQFDPLANSILQSAWFPKYKDLKPFPHFHERRDGQLVLHQSLVTTFHLRYISTKSNKFKVSIREWDGDVFEEFADNDTTKRTFIFLDTTDGDPWVAPEPWLHEAVKNRQLNLYPSQREMEMEQGKLELVKILDSITESAKELEFKFRPVTCFGGGICPLQGHEQTVYKRSWSASSAHLKIKTERLACVPCIPLTKHDENEKDKQENEKEQENVPWLHQEYLPLVARGEFRVFVVPGEDLKGRVFEWVHAAVNRSNKDVKDLVLVTKPSGDDSREFAEKKTTEKKLKEFALFVYKELRKRLPNMSFDQGARLDIGAGGDGMLWVVEATPWYSAHYFSMTGLPFPNTQICEEFARSLARSME